MNTGTKLRGLLIRLERVKKGWSQQGLCQGICAVSYLSKIEQGKTDADSALISLLLARLGIRWDDEPELNARASCLVDALYEAVFDMDWDGAKALLAAQCGMLKTPGPYWIDALLIRSLLRDDRGETQEELKVLEPAMTERQYALWLYLRGQYDELLRVSPTAFYFTQAGAADYERGEYARAIERLLRGYELAAQDGAARVMLQARVMLGNCHSNLAQYDQMLLHYRATEKLARALKDDSTLATIGYNIAATQLELGKTQEAYAYFSALETPSALSLHKLAICCEKLGKPDEALDALARIPDAPEEYPGRALLDQMCALVRFRLKYPDYLKQAQYGDMLLSCFARIRRELPMGYALFHLPWVIQWHKAARQYKQICELLESFPRFHG